jgi:hypothetical protein
MNLEKQFPATLEHNIKDRGAMETIISDGAKTATSARIKSLCGIFQIKNYQSEPHHRHQNFAENRIAGLWLLALLYVCTLLNHMVDDSLGEIAPWTALLGLSPDISIFLAFSFYEPVFYSADNKHSSVSTEPTGRLVGFATNEGDAMTFKIILTDDTHQVITRSAVHSRNNDKDPNLNQA